MKNYKKRIRKIENNVFKKNDINLFFEIISKDHLKLNGINYYTEKDVITFLKSIKNKYNNFYMFIENFEVEYFKDENFIKRCDEILVN